jgi:hypothetical protein
LRSRYQSWRADATSENFPSTHLGEYLSTGIIRTNIRPTRTSATTTAIPGSDDRLPCDHRGHRRATPLQPGHLRASARIGQGAWAPLEERGGEPAMAAPQPLTRHDVERAIGLGSRTAGGVSPAGGLVRSDNTLRQPIAGELDQAWMRWLSYGRLWSAFTQPRWRAALRLGRRRCFRQGPRPG